MDIEKAYQDRYTLAPLSRRRLNTDSVVHFAAAVYITPDGAIGVDLLLEPHPSSEPPS
jgi:hypothetical protein